MPLRDEYLRRAKIILQSLTEEQIQTPDRCVDKCDTAIKLGVVREKAMALAEDYLAPGLTSNVAITLLKVAACRELAQRFALEYILLFKQANVNLIFLGNPKTLDQGGDNHVFVLLGSTLASDELFVGRAAGPVLLAEQKHYLPLNHFLKQQDTESILVDPLLDFAESVQDSCVRLRDYCERHHITDVVGIRSYETSFGIIENAALIKENARSVASKIEKKCSSLHLDRFFQSQAKASKPQPIAAKQDVIPAKPSAIENISKEAKKEASSATFGFKPGFLNKKTPAKQQEITPNLAPSTH